MTADLFGDSEEQEMAEQKPTPKAADTAVTEDAAPRFEDVYKRLEQVVDEMEQGELPLEEQIKRFEEGVALVKECRKFLKQANLRVKRYVAKRDGRWVLKDMDE